MLRRSADSAALLPLLLALALPLAACSDDGGSGGTDTDPDLGDAADLGGDADEDADVGSDTDDADDGEVDVADTGGETGDDAGGDTDSGADADADDADGADDIDAGPTRTLDDWPTWVEPPTCGTAVDWPGWIPAPGEEDYDEALGTKARRLERQFHVFNTLGVGLNRELSVSLADTESRGLIEDFILESDSWDFEEWSGGTAAADVITSYHKVAGAYAGVGAAADAFRYATLLREGADCDDIERARQFLIADLEALHVPVAITGVEGVIARGFARADQPGTGYETVPLFDEGGNPLPEEKTNGTWRADNSGGLYPDLIWEDSCSRDMLIGWALGMSAVWEVIRDDPSFPGELKDRLRADALAIARSLMTVQDSGFDMEIRDSDGRMTFHGILHHESIDRAYLRGIKNGFNAMMGLGIMAGFAFITEDPAVEAYVYEELVDRRGYLTMIVRDMNALDLGYGSNFSMYNMVMQGGWLAQRYLRDPAARAEVNRSIQTAIYDRGGIRQPREQKQTFFDFTYLASLTGESAFSAPEGEIDEPGRTALANGLETLGEWNDMPYWDFGHNNCDEAEIESRECIGDDGTPITLLGTIGRNGDLVAEDPVPMRIRPASNYWWRSNPYKPNGGGDGSGLYPGSDFRIVYWMARYYRQPPSE